MAFEYDYPNGWHVETTHDITTDPLCNDAIEPTIAFATDWGSTAFQHQFNDDNGNSHVIVVRQTV
jgi:hypothetical protein